MASFVENVNKIAGDLTTELIDNINNAESNATSASASAAASAASALAASASEQSALSSASTALSNATIATTQAGLAQGYASNAESSASIATTQAGIATNAANTSEDYYNQIAGYETELTIVSNNIDDINTVATELNNLVYNENTESSINVVAENIVNIGTVANIDDEVSVVANISTDVSTVSGISSNVSTVASIDSNVSTVASISSNVTTVAGISSNVTTVAGDIDNINVVATDLNETVSEISTVATNITDVNTVGNNIANVNTVSTNIDDVSTVANVSDDVTTVADISTNVTSVADISANVTTVAGISSNVTTVADISSNVTTVATNINDIGTVVTNLTEILAADDNAAIATDMKEDAEKLAINAEDLEFILSDGTTIGYSALHYNTKAEDAKEAAELAKIAAEEAQVATEALYDAFDDRYLGAKSTNPSLDNDGNALQIGAIYWNTTNNQLYVWSGTQWNNAAFAVSEVVISFNTRTGAVTLNNTDVTNAVGQSLQTTDDVTFAALITDSVQLTGGTGDEGTLSWNNSDRTLDLEQGGVTLQLGQEMHMMVRNATGSTIGNGTFLGFTGVTVGSNRVMVGPFDSSTMDADMLVGFATEDISNGVNGFATSFGYVRGLDTRGTSASNMAVGDEDWSVGDILYPHPSVAGKLTNVEPISGFKASVCVVTNRHATEGEIFVRVTGIDENAYATAAQGALADSALQSGDNVSELTNDAGYITTVTASDIDSETATDGYVLTADGSGNANWVDAGVSDLTGYIQDTAHSFSATSINQVFSNNLTIKTGKITTGSDGKATIVFPTAFATACVYASYKPLSGWSSGDGNDETVISISNSSMAIQNEPFSRIYTWIAIGY